MTGDIGCAFSGGFWEQTDKLSLPDQRREKHQPDIAMAATEKVRGTKERQEVFLWLPFTQLPVLV